ncbi:MAG: UDP-glucose 4-epimerase GalE [Alphaproteobacteria bacterium]|nr:MAG: UDP-glucose 4-epimerase GalE [Alphaproteobacteria bacterium]
MTRPVLVTGGAGYIGAQVVHALHDARRRVVALDRLPAGDPRWGMLPEGVAKVIGDVGDPACLEGISRTHGLGAIMHLAARIDVAESVARPLDYYVANVLASRTLLAWAMESGIGRFVFSSSAAVYGSDQPQPVSEDAVLVPASPYGETKRLVERMLDHVAAQAGTDGEGFTAVSLRYFNVAGADRKGRTGPQAGRSDVISSACRAALEGRPFRIFGDDWPTVDGTPVRDFIHVDDLARAHLAALDLMEGADAQACVHRVFNCGTGRGYSVAEVARAVEAVHGAPLIIEEAPRRPGDVAEMVAEPSRFEMASGWRARHRDLEDIVADHYRWLARNDRQQL